MKWDIKRKQPYTAAGIKRVPCIRCDEPATYQWQICADGNNYRPLCVTCDLALNAWVLTFMRHPKSAELFGRYRAGKA
jgi:hypothetical protein